MTTQPTARETAIHRVREQIGEATSEAANAGYVIAINIGGIVDDVVKAYDLDELKLPRYYPEDEKQDAHAYLVGTARHVDPDAGIPPNLYIWWRTDIPGDRLELNLGYGISVAEARSKPPVASCTTPADVLGNLCRILLAAAAHSQANPHPSATLVDTTPETQEQDPDGR